MGSSVFCLCFLSDLFLHFFIFGWDFLVKNVTNTVPERPFRCLDRKFSEIFELRHHDHHLQLQGSRWSSGLLALKESPDLLETTALAHKDDKHGDAAEMVDYVDGHTDGRADMTAHALVSQQLAQRFKTPGETQDEPKLGIEHLETEKMLQGFPLSTIHVSYLANSTYFNLLTI